VEIVELDMKIDLTDPAAYESGQPWDQFRWLQDNDPTHWHELPGDEPGYYALTRYADLKAVEGDHERFANEPNSTLFDVNTQGDATHKNLIFADPPFHTEQRRFLSPELSPRSVKEFAGHVARVVDDVIDEVIETGQCDLATDIGGKLASYVTADMMGLPRELLVDLYVLSEELNNTKSITEGQGLAAMLAMAGHAQSVYDDRKAAPRGDMVSRMVNGEYNGCPVDPLQFSLDFLLVVNAGGDTTRNVVGGGMLALFENPAQRAKLMADPELIPSGVDEMLRWVSPIVYQRRTATRDTEFGGLPIKKGTKLAGYYGAANRDPRAFREPDIFDVERRPNAHVAFGFGPHFCLGSHLARQELILMFRQLLARTPDLEPRGPAIWTLPPGVAPTVVGPRSIPVAFTPGPRVNS
jgi:cytochrome P450